MNEIIALADAGVPTRARVRLKILYISFTGRQQRPYEDPSTRYRCFYPAEYLRSIGHLAFVTSQDALPNLDPSFFDIMVVHRPSFNPVFNAFINKAKASHVVCIADYDDLIFNPVYAFSSSMFKNNYDPTSVSDTFRRNTDALHLFRYFSVSTKALGEQIMRVVPDARVVHVPNSVPASLAEFVKSHRFEARGDRLTIGYFPGTKTHDEDFGVCAESLRHFCADRRIPLLVVGPLELPSNFDSVNVERLDVVSFEEMFELLAQCRVVIAPLCETPFNSCKSHIKLLEASLACTPLVYTKIPDMMQHQSVAPYGVEHHADWLPVLSAAWDNYDSVANARLQKYFCASVSTRTAMSTFVKG